MQKPIRLVGAVICSLSITMAGNALATPIEEALHNTDGQAAGENTRGNDCHLFFVKANLSMQEAGMEAGDPINTLHLFVTGPDGKIIKNAQVVTNIIDQQGNQQLSRALPFKGGYLLDIAHLAPGPYLVEAEILANSQFLGKLFHFNKG